MKLVKMIVPLIFTISLLAMIGNPHGTIPVKQFVHAIGTDHLEPEVKVVLEHDFGFLTVQLCILGARPTVHRSPPRYHLLPSPYLATTSASTIPS